MEKKKNLSGKKEKKDANEKIKSDKIRAATELINYFIHLININ